MKRTSSGWAVALSIATLLLSPFGVAAMPATPATRGLGDAHVLGTFVLEDGLIVDETLVGGISGVDYDPATGIWYMISDDRSDLDPARFYTGSIEIMGAGIDDVTIESAVTLLQEDGTPFPNATAGGDVPDFETIRVDPQSGAIWYGGEGDPSLGLSPSIATADPDGEWISRLPLPELFEIDPSEEIGPRPNKGIEAMTFSADGETIWFAMEAALYQDGELSTVEQGSVSRLTQVDRDGNVLASYPYVLDPLMHVPDGGSGSNGLPEILAISDTTFLTLERLSVEDANGVYTNYIRIYEVDIAGATDVSTMTALDGGEWTPVSKRLVVDLNEAGVEPVDNIEALSWGPVLENGNRTLVAVSDNNFNPGDQFTVFVALEVVD